MAAFPGDKFGCPELNGMFPAPPAAGIVAGSLDPTVASLRLKLAAAEKLQRKAADATAVLERQLQQQLKTVLDAPHPSGVLISSSPLQSPVGVPVLQVADAAGTKTTVANGQATGEDEKVVINIPPALIVIPAPRPTPAPAVEIEPPVKTSTGPNPCSAAVRESVLRGASTVHLQPYMTVKTREDALTILENFAAGMQKERPGLAPDGTVIAHSGRSSKPRSRKKKTVVKKEKKETKQKKGVKCDSTKKKPTRKSTRDSKVDYTEQDSDEVEEQFTSDEDELSSLDDSASDEHFRGALSVLVGWEKVAQYVYDEPSMNADMLGKVIVVALVEDGEIRMHVFRTLKHYESPKGKGYNYELQYLSGRNGSGDKCDMALELEKYAHEPATGCILSMTEEKSWVIVSESPQ